MAEVKWIKITTDMFDNRKIKYIRRLPEGDSIVLIWVMLLTMAGRCNDGGRIWLTENIPYNAKSLANELGFEEATVMLALDALENLRMIDRTGGCLAIPGWEEYQNTEGMEKIREQNRLRKQKQRENQKLLIASRDSHVTVTTEVTACHATDIDKERDLEERIRSCSIEQEAVTRAPAREEQTPKKRFGAHVLLSMHEYSDLLRNLGTADFLRRMKLVDRPENEGKDFYRLILAAE